jgi:hypothetical protein
MTGAALDRAAGAKPDLVPPRVPKLEQTLEPNQRHTGDQKCDVQRIPPATTRS